MDIKKAIAVRLKALLEEKDFTVEKLSEKTELPVKTIKKILNVEYQKVSINRVFVICRALGMSLSEFYDDKIFDEITLQEIA